MSMTNCVNCGSAKEADAKVCPFCGTSYFDFTDIDLDGKHPCIVRFAHGGHVFQMKAFPSIAEITLHPVDMDIRGVDGRIMMMSRNNNITARIEFVSAG